MSNNKKTKKVAEDKAALNKSLLAKLLCIRDSKGRQNFSLRKLALFFLTGIGCWWFCIHWYIDTREYASHDLTLKAFILAFAVSFVPILSFLIGSTEKLEVRTTERLMSLKWLSGNNTPPKSVVWVVKVFISVVQSGSVFPLLFACAFVAGRDIESWNYLLTFAAVAALTLFYQSTRKTERDLIINEGRFSTASIHTSSSFNIKVEKLGVKEYFGLVKDACEAIEQLESKKEKVTLKSHLVSPTLQVRFERELRDSIEWTVEPELIKSSNFYSFWAVALSSLGYGKGLELEPTYKMVIRRLTEAEKKEKIELLEQKKEKALNKQQ